MIRAIPRRGDRAVANLCDHVRNCRRRGRRVQDGAASARRRDEDDGSALKGVCYPICAADAIIRAVETPDPPLHLPLGNDALRFRREKLEALSNDFNAREETTIGADFPASTAS